MRELPFADGSVDLALCISTLEHVGRDNEIYDVDAPRDDTGDEAALRELHRVLSGEGRLLVSVPTGEHEDQGWQVQRTVDDWVALFERCGFLVYEDELYLHGEDGWRSATPAEVRGVALRRRPDRAPERCCWRSCGRARSAHACGWSSATRSIATSRAAARRCSRRR